MKSCVVRQLLGLILALTWISCTTVESISVSQIPAAPARKHKISAAASNPILLLIPFGSSFPERAREQLLAQCPAGKIEGLLAKHQMTNYFLSLVQVDEVLMEGYCIQTPSKG